MASSYDRITQTYEFSLWDASSSVSAINFLEFLPIKADEMLYI
jgi:hypothetical protein